MNYIDLEKLQEFVELNLPLDEEYAHQGIAEKMVLDERKRTIGALCAFVNRHKQEKPDVPAETMKTAQEYAAANNYDISGMEPEVHELK